MSHESRLGSKSKHLGLLNRVNLCFIANKFTFTFIKMRMCYFKPYIFSLSNKDSQVALVSSVSPTASEGCEAIQKTSEALRFSMI